MLELEVDTNRYSQIISQNFELFRNALPLASNLEDKDM